MNFFNFDVLSTRQSVSKNKILRQVGLKREVYINNVSGKKAWLILSPTPILQVGSLGLDKVGQIAFTHAGEYKSQQSPLADQTKRKFDVDSSTIYYTVFFECDGGWKLHFKDKKHDVSNVDINLLPRHVEESVDFDVKPM
jgi:hypothetical protein